MSWRGRLALTCVLVSVALGLGLATFAGAAPLPPPSQLGQLSAYKLPDGAPKLMGPSIIDAVYRATTAAGAGNDSLFIIFSEDLDETTVAAADFNFNGGLAYGDVGGIAGGSIARLGRNLVVMSGFTTAFAAGDSVQLATMNAVTGLDGSDSKDVSLVAIRTGPAIYRAEVRWGAPGSGDTDIFSNRPRADTLRVYFTHEIVSTTLATANPRTDFEMDEFGTGTANLTSALRTTAPFANKVVDIIFGNQEAASAPSHGKIIQLVSKLRVRTGALAGNFAGDTALQDANTASPYHTVDEAYSTSWGRHIGPYIVALGYNDKGTGTRADDVLTVVLSRDIEPASVQLSDFGFTPGTAAGTSMVLGHNDGDHILTLTDFTGATTSTIGAVMDWNGPITDFQGNSNTDVDADTVLASPIIVQARYQDAGDSDPTTDILEVFFDEPVIGSFADTTDFSYYGFVSNGLIVTDNTDNDSLIAFTGFTAGNQWRPGNRISMRAGSDLEALSSPRGNGRAFNEADAWNEVGPYCTHIVRDYSAPRQLHFALNYNYFRHTASVPDTAFLAYDERDVDDSGYFILFTRKDFPVSMTYVQTYFNNGVYMANPNPGSLPPGDGGPLNNRNLITTYDITPGAGTYSDGQVIEPGTTPEMLHAGILAVDSDGNLALTTTSYLFSGSLPPGELEPPRDHDCVMDIDTQNYLIYPGVTTDTDMIHVTGGRNPHEHFVFGDAGAAIGADSIRVYDDAGLTVRLGSGPCNSVSGAFPPIAIGEPTGDWIYLISVDVEGGTESISASYCAIRNDYLLFDKIYAGTFHDPVNLLKRYSPGDTVRIVGAVADTNRDLASVVNASLARKSDLMVLAADFRGFNTGAGMDSVVFISLGANKNDEDNDWVDNGPPNLYGTARAGNNNRDYPEPYVDENGNGQYDCGETFVDYIDGIGSGSVGGDTLYVNKIYDYGDSNLDSNDPQEHGWYYVQHYINPSTMTASPGGSPNFATLEDVNIPIRITDNGITGQGALDQLSSELPGQANRAPMTYLTSTGDDVHGLSLAHLTTPPLDTYQATLDAQSPMVSEIPYLARQMSLGQVSQYPNNNLITPGDNVYGLPSGLTTGFINFVDSTLSDDDVQFIATQFDTTANTSDNLGWRYMSLDPGGDRGVIAHNDGLPGIPLLDDDYDSTACKVNVVDDDEDGNVDEDGEGVDLSDPEVVDAMQADLAADAAGVAPDGICRINDGIDNDNDAFFRYDPFNDSIVWFNIDESTTNGVDDDGDGTVDEADGSETETYNAVQDNDEDGMTAGSVGWINLSSSQMTITQLTNGGAGQAPTTIGVKLFEDPAVLAKYRGSKNSKPVPYTVIPGATPGSWLASYLDKTSNIIGNLQSGLTFSGHGGTDNMASTRFSFGARDMIGNTIGFPVSLRGGSSPTFNWDYRAMTGRNIDMSRIQRLYDLVDGSEYRMRGVAVDQAYNHNPSWAVPVRFKLDSTPPVVCIPPAHNSTTDGTGAYPEFDDFVDVRPLVPGLQIYDKGAHPGPYTLQAEIVGTGTDIANVWFQVWDPNALSWVNLPANPMNPDPSLPYTLFWDPPLLNNNPPANADTVYFRAVAIDTYGNMEPQGNAADPNYQGALSAPTAANGPTTATCVADDRVWELEVIVIDGTPPMACLDQVGSDYKPCDGAAMPVEAAVDVSAWFDDGDGDPLTNDVIHVYFEYTPIGLNTWSPFASLTGVPADGYLRDPGGIQHPIIYRRFGPAGRPPEQDCGMVVPDSAMEVTVTWDTRGLEPGSYEIRAVAVDIEGNTSVLTSCVFTVTLDNSALRAYIQPVLEGSNSLDTCGIAAVDTLFAQVFIHDRSVSKVEFQYYSDFSTPANPATDGDGIANDLTGAVPNTWHTIFIQGDTPDERKGDVTLRAGSGSAFHEIRTAVHDRLNTLNGGRVKYWDPDGDGYSPVDPIVYDGNNDGVYHYVASVEYVACVGPGNVDPPEGATLTAFASNEYAANIPSLTINCDDWIMQDNAIDPAGANQTNVWWCPWDITGLNGDYLVRAVATDNLGNTDTDLTGTPIPTALINIDSVIPKAVVTNVTLPDGTVLNIPPQGQYISAENKYFYVTAEPVGSSDIKKILFDYSRDGGATWDTLDVNDDQDMFADLDGDLAFDKGLDEIFYDVDGDNAYSDGDIVLSKGTNGMLDTPLGFALCPLVTEDGNNAVDTDGDGKIDEDAWLESDLGGQSPDDFFPPYVVPFCYALHTFPTETNVLFRAIATDNNGNVDCDPDMVSVVVGDNVPPETDIVVAVVNGDSLDLETVLRGTLSPACLDTNTIGPMQLLVTAEDQAEITNVEIWYRLAPPSSDPLVALQPQYAWTFSGMADDTYPYDFDHVGWDIESLPDGLYEFYAKATDANDNVTPPPTNPYHFSILRATASLTSVTLLGSGLSATEVAPGDVVVLAADVSGVTVPGQVCFYTAERIEDEEVTGISMTYPYTSLALAHAMVPAAGNGINEVVMIGAEEGIYVPLSEWATTPGKTYRHYTVRGGDVLEFGAAIASGTTVTISYNVTAWSSAGCDLTTPYTTEWSVPSVKSVNASTHYDLMAIYVASGLSCGESYLSEGWHIRILDVVGPLFLVYGIDDVNDNNSVTTDPDNLPGNSLFISRGEDEHSFLGSRIMKLSGDWADFFVDNNITKAGEEDDFASVVMNVTNTAGTASLTFTKVDCQPDPIQTIHKTLFLSDYETLDRTRVENVNITVDGYPDAPTVRKFAMYDDGTNGDLVAGDGHYTATLALPTGVNCAKITYKYQYTIDLVGDDYISGDDHRNEGTSGWSTIILPALPYWTASVQLDNDALFLQNAVNHVEVVATDLEGNVTTNMSKNNQGQIDVILDRVAPTVVDLKLAVGFSGQASQVPVKVGGDVEIFANIIDPVPPDANIIRIRHVTFQVSPDISRNVWLDWFGNYSPNDGWGDLTHNWPFNPLTDDIDNDRDGTFDEPDEGTFVYQIRALPMDDGHNVGYSNEQNPPVVAEVTVDATPPVTALTVPANGDIVQHGSVITLTAMPDAGTTDVLYMLFEYNVGSGWQVIDATPNDDTDEIDGWEGEHTPQTVKNQDGSYSVTWDTSFLDEADFYVRLRSVARDIAGNFEGGQGPLDAGDPPVEYITILINDQTAPMAALTGVLSNGPSYIYKHIVDPTLAIRRQVVLVGVAGSAQAGAHDQGQGDVQTVILQYSTNGTHWLDGGITNVIIHAAPMFGEQRQFFILFDTRALGLPDGDVWLRTAGTDHDGNLQGDANLNGILEDGETVPGVVQVRVDNSEPAMWLTQVGPVAGSPVPDETLIQYDLWPSEVARGGEYEVDDPGLRLSDDLTLKAADPSDGSVDVLDGVYLQFYDDWTDAEHPVWRPSFPPIPEIDYDHNGAVTEDEVMGWFANYPSYLEAYSDFLVGAFPFKFKFRDAAGNDSPPGAPNDGNWYLTFANIMSLKAAMDTAGVAVEPPKPGELNPAADNIEISRPSLNLPDKLYNFRALAIDYAGNANTGYMGHVLRIDAVNPWITNLYAGNYEMEGGGGDYVTVRVAGGDDVPLAALVFDDYPLVEGRGQEPAPGQVRPEGFDPDLPGTTGESCGMHGVRFDYRAQGMDQRWHIIGLGNWNVDHGMWEITWTTPENLSNTGPQAGQGSSNTDSLFTIRAVAVDSAGNYSAYARPNAVSVQDITPPDDTEIVDIDGRTYPPDTNEETVRDPAGTMIAGMIDISAATQYGDASMMPQGFMGGAGVYMPEVFFEARQHGVTGAPWLAIGSTKVPDGGGDIIIPKPGDVSPLSNSHLGPVWTVRWYTLQVDGNNDRIWPDGQYDVRAYARDAWGNIEILTGTEAPMTVLVTIDNTPPVALVDANPNTPSREIEATIDRNNPDGYTFVVNTGVTNEDVVMTYYYKLSTDLNVPDAWQMVWPGFDATDDNPDHTRPFSFNWNTNAIAGCDTALVPGETYDIVAEATDLLSNYLGAVAAHDAGYSIRLHVVDQTAPKATITELQRSVGNLTPVEFPEYVRVRGIEYMNATILNGARDVESVQFYFTPKTSATAPAFSASTWTLADADISQVGDLVWQLTDWDTSPLAEGEYWFAAVATDCYNNSDTAPATIVLVIDRTKPVFVAVNPTTEPNGDKLVPEINTPNGPRLIDLIVKNTDNDVDYTSMSVNAIRFEYKRSEDADVPANWTTITSQELKDNGPPPGSITPTYAAAVNIRTLKGDGLYDWRVVASDVAGNETRFVWAEKTVVDNTPPVIEITDIQFPNRQDLTVQPVNGGILPDISAGELVKLYVTASDDEAAIPPSHETAVYEVQFFLGSGPDRSGTYPQNLGTAGYDGTRNQYYINWNTTGLMDGDYTIYARGEDEVRNFAASQTVTGNVTNPAKPLAQVSAFNPDLLSEITKGTNDRIYGLTFGEKLASTMFFQYRAQKPGETGFSEWINIGAARNTGEVLSSREAGLLPQHLWFSNMRISDLPDNTVMEFRAVAVGASSVDSLGFSGNVATEPATEAETSYYGRTPITRGLETMDGQPGDFSGLYDLANTPIIKMLKTSKITGEAQLEFNEPGLGLITDVTSQGNPLSFDGLVTVKTGNAKVSPFVVLVAEDGEGDIDESIPEMNRRIDDGTVWTGDINGRLRNFHDINPDEGARVTMFASAHLKRTSITGLAPRIDMKWKTWLIHQITPNAGSNGVAGIDGRGYPANATRYCDGNGALFTDNYPTDPFAVQVPPGVWDRNMGMLLERVDRPVTPTEQDLYINAFGPTYALRFMDGRWQDRHWRAENEGWTGKAWIRYDDTDPAIEGNEGNISVRYWTYGDDRGWDVYGLRNISVDTCANVVTFNFMTHEIADEFTFSGDDENLIFSLVATDRFAPVVVDAYPMHRGMTDQDPIFKIILTNTHGNAVDPSWFRILIDGKVVAFVDGHTMPGRQTFLVYDGSWLDIQPMDIRGHQMALTFGWPCDADFALKEGQHKIEVWFCDTDDYSEIFGVDQPIYFEVDATPPTVVFNGGWVSNPLLKNVPAYVGAKANALTVTLIDHGSGVLFRPNRIDDDDYSHYWWWDVEDYCKIARYGLLYDEWFYENDVPIQFDVDDGFKYDLWRVNNCDSCNACDIDYVESRTLLHTGTADELWPNVITSVTGDTLTVPLNIMGGGAIQDGDVLEVTLYSKRYEIAPFTKLQEFLSLIGYYGGYYEDGWWLDCGLKGMVQYAASIQDNVFNTGSRFVEQRFIVDTSAPTFDVTSPGVSCDGSPVTPIEPVTDYTFTASFDDGNGCGLDVSKTTVTISGPVKDGDEDGITLLNYELTEEGVKFTIPKSDLLVGQYNIRIKGEDKLGNKFDKTCVLYVGSSRLTLTDAIAYPNPFNPQVDNVKISFVNDREATVMLKIYDFNGDEVWSKNVGAVSVGPQVIEWGGMAEDGTPLGNGVYMARIEANDGRRIETKVLRIAIWRD